MARSMKPLEAEFYERPVLEVARELIGCRVEHRGAAGVIVETEAYHESEPACHAFVGLTPRTSTLFGRPGRAYVYRSYGIHALLNAVCEPQGVGAAVLIRALQPISGLEAMRVRRLSGTGAAHRTDDEHLCSGPGKLTQALAVSFRENATSLHSGAIRILSPTVGWSSPVILTGARVGISRAVELPWRFCVAGNRHVSRPWLRSTVEAAASDSDAVASGSAPSVTTS